MVEQKEESDQVGLRQRQQQVEHAALLGHAVRQSCKTRVLLSEHTFLFPHGRRTWRCKQTDRCLQQSWDTAHLWKAVLATRGNTASGFRRWRSRPFPSSWQTRPYCLRSRGDTQLCTRVHACRKKTAFRFNVRVTHWSQRQLSEPGCRSQRRKLCRSPLHPSLAVRSPPHIAERWAGLWSVHAWRHPTRNGIQEMFGTFVLLLKLIN